MELPEDEELAALQREVGVASRLTSLNPPRCQPWVAAGRQVPCQSKCRGPRGRGGGGQSEAGALPGEKALGSGAAAVSAQNGEGPLPCRPARAWMQLSVFEYKVISVFLPEEQNPMRQMQEKDAQDSSPGETGAE